MQLELMKSNVSNCHLLDDTHNIYCTVNPCHKNKKTNKCSELTRSPVCMFKLHSGKANEHFKIET